MYVQKPLAPAELETLIPSVSIGMSKKESRLEIRLHADEKKELKQKADRLGISVSDYIRVLAYKRKFVTRTDLAMYIQLSKIGSNINQIAHALNANPQRCLSESDMAILEEVKKLIAETKEKIRTLPNVL